MRIQLLNAKEDLEWLREVHLGDCEIPFKSALVHGNEDWPEKIEVFEKENPTIYCKPMKVFYP